MKELIWSDFPKQEYLERWNRASQLMEEENVDVLLLTQYENVRYFSGYLSILWLSKFRPLVAILPKDQSIQPSIILPGQERGNSLTSWIDDVIIYSDQVDPIPYISECLKGKGFSRANIGAELGFGERLGCTYHQFEELKARLPDAQFVSATRLIQEVRMHKSPAEVECLRKACEISQKGVKAGWEALQPGITERELVSIMVSTMYREGAEAGISPSLYAIRAGRRRNKIGNALPTDTVIQEGDFVVVDGGACYKGYVCDFIRQAFVGNPSKDQLDLFNLTVEANDAAIASIKPGVTGADVYEATVKVFEQAGLGKFSQYNIVGHGIGLEIHELPWLGERDLVYSSDVMLKPGACLSVEPIISGLKDLKGTPDPNQETGRFIVEDVVAVTESGCENLTKSLSKQLWIKG
jgi:Xaa-Pro aminopeptidase